MALTKTNLANIVEGILPVANGGTGTSTGQAAAGSNTQIQYNSSGAFAGSSNFVFDGTNVGIGTSSPAAKLHLSGTSGNQELRFTDTTNTATGRIYEASGLNIISETNHPINFQTNAVGRMQIDTSGNLSLTTASTSILNSSGRAILKQTGGILQVVSASLSSPFSTTNQTATNTTLSASITPSNTSTKIYAIVAGGAFGYTNSGSSNYSFNIYRGGSSGTQVCGATINTTGSVSQLQMPGALQGIDSPASTSAQTYYLVINTQPGVGGTVTVREGAVLILMEIAQ